MSNRYAIKKLPKKEHPSRPAAALMDAFLPTTPKRTQLHILPARTLRRLREIAQVVASCPCRGLRRGNLLALPPVFFNPTTVVTTSPRRCGRRRVEIVTVVLVKTRRRRRVLLRCASWPKQSISVERARIERLPQREVGTVHLFSISRDEDAIFKTCGI